MFSAIENISLFIPRVHWNTEKRYVISKFACFGEVSGVDMVLKQDNRGGMFYMVYVHFAYWHSDPETREFHATILDPNADARFYHEPHRYWIVSKMVNCVKPAATKMGRRLAVDLDAPIPLVRQTNEACLRNDVCFEPIPLTRQTNESCLLPPSEEEKDERNMDEIEDYLLEDVYQEYEREMLANLARDTRDIDELYGMMEEIENVYM